LKAAAHRASQVPDFIALTTDAETTAIARTIGQVLFDDLRYENEFQFVPRDVYSTIPKATSFADVPFDRWRELNADGVVVGTVQKSGNSVRVEIRILNVRNHMAAFSRLVYRLGRQPSGDRAPRSRRDLSNPAFASRSGAEQVDLCIRPRWRTHDRHG
jgi:TolB-like protein